MLHTIGEEQLTNQRLNKQSMIMQTIITWALSRISFLTAPNTVAPTYITASAGNGGTISSSGITRLNYGDSQTFTIAPDSGYHIADVLVNGSSVGSVSSYSIQDIGGATTISATFAIDPTPTPASTPTANPTTYPTANPTTSSTQNPSVSPSPASSLPEFPYTILLAIMLVATTCAILFYRKLRAPALFEVK